jgi:hypothetical protein
MTTGYPQLTAYLLDVLLHNDRGLREAGPPRNRQEWGVGQVSAYLRAIGLETIEEGGEVALWRLLYGSVALLPCRREEALHRLVRYWGSLEGWLDDQDIPAPTRPGKHRTPAIERIAG